MRAEDLPLSLKWVPLFVDSTNRVMGDLYAWDVLEVESQPLQYVLHLRFFSLLDKDKAKNLRGYLSSWADANDAVYRKSFWKKKDFKALVLVKGLGPEMTKSPFD